MGEEAAKVMSYDREEFDAKKTGLTASPGF